jgi:hypothetical protein
MITPNHSKLFKELDKSRIDKVQILNTPVVKVTLSGEIDKTEFGGDRTIVHYNRQKEIDASTRRLQKRFRTLRKQAKHVRCITLGDELPNVTLLNREGERNG